jgi:nucleoside-diphosphate-sugar epimerase
VILVTGASGHLGINLVKRLSGKGEKVRALVKTHRVDIPGVEVMTGDITDPESAKMALSGAETVYHLAAAVDGYGTLPRDLVYKVNVLGTKNMIENFKGSRFIYMSTTSVYGYDMKENPAKPSTPYNPSAYYGKTKVEAEKLVLAHNGIVVRAPVIFGPGFNKTFETLLDQIKNGKVPIVGSGNNHIQWMHVNDLMDALLLVKELGIPGSAYLVAGKDVITQEGLYGMLAQAIGVEPPKKHVSLSAVKMMASFGKLSSKITGKPPRIRMEHINRLVSDRQFDISKAEAELGFHPQVTYAKWVQELASGYKQR